MNHVARLARQSVFAFTALFAVVVLVAVPQFVSAQSYAWYPGYGYYPAYPPYYSNVVVNPAPLVCTQPYGQVAVGASATFVAQNGVGTYDWVTSERTYVNAGRILNTTFSQPGPHTVSVTSGGQTAVCTISVTGGQVYIAPGYSNAPTVVAPRNGGGYIVAGVPSISLSALPNTGFAPLGAEQIAFSIVILISAALLVFPYVRKAFVAVIR